MQKKTWAAQRSKNYFLDYLVEINYGSFKKFLTVKKGQYILEKIDEYRQGQSLQVFYRGVEIFNQQLTSDVDEFKRKNKVIKHNSGINKKKNIIAHFVDGPFLEIKEDGDNLYNVQFINKKNNKIEFEINDNQKFLFVILFLTSYKRYLFVLWFFYTNAN